MVDITSAFSGLSGASDSIRSGSWTGGLFSAIGTSGMFIFNAIIVIIIVGVALSFMMRSAKYKRKMIIFRLFSTGVKMLTRRVYIGKNKKGEYECLILGSLNPLVRAKRITTFDQKYFISTLDNKNECMFVVQLSDEDYKPLEFKQDMINQTLKCSVVDLNANNHLMQMQRSIIDKYKNKNKTLMYSPVAICLIGAVFVIILVWITLGRLENVGANLSSLGTAISDAAKNSCSQRLG